MRPDQFRALWYDAWMSGSYEVMEYEIKESARAKLARITINADGHVTITKPSRMPHVTLEAWLRKKRGWIEEMQTKLKERRERHERKYGAAMNLPKLRRGSAAYKEAIKEARALASACVKTMATKGGFTYGTISIRNQKTRWGSCSARGNLSFNYRLVHLPPPLLEYLVVHELAHTKHRNHSARFWEEVARLVPDYAARRRELQRYRF